MFVAGGTRLGYRGCDDRSEQSGETHRVDPAERTFFPCSHGVGSAIYYPLSLHRQDCFGDLGYKQGAFPESERAAAETLSLPVNPDLTEDERSYVAEKVRAFYGA